MRPVIGVSISLERGQPGRPLFPNKPLQYIEEGMVAALRSAGCTPILLPLLDDAQAASDLVGICHGLVFSGGADIAPESYGESAIDPAWCGDRRRDLYELALVHAGIEARKPMLGICRGCQLLSVAHGGTMYQDIATQCPAAIQHRDPDVYDRLEHDVRVVESTRLAELIGAGRQRSNSVHHQAIREVGMGLRASAHAVDGVIEAIEAERAHQSDDPGDFILGIQWHPEWMQGPRSILEAFVAAAREKSLS